MSAPHSPIIPSIILALGLAASAFVLGMALKDMRTSGRSVNVKGLVERDVKADKALWLLKTKVAGDDLAQTQTRMEENIATLTRFLKDKGFKDEEFTAAPLRVLDRKAMEYGEARADQLRYIIEGSIMVRTDNVDLVQKTSGQTSEIVRSGVTLAQENACAAGPNFLFTKLNDIKPAMLAEATQNARKAAEQFAADSGSEVGSIKQAYQGAFSVAPRDQTESGDGGGNCDTITDPNKKVRVVTTVEYYLAD